MFNTVLFIVSGAFALLGWSTVVAGFVLSLKNRRRRSHYKEKEAVELMLCGAVIIVLAALLALSSL
jgi:threonine/homoserine/homoserine lactone efflux protein